MITSFTAQEKFVLRFLGAAVLVGLATRTVREGLWFTGDDSQLTQNEPEVVVANVLETGERSQSLSGIPAVEESITVPASEIVNINISSKEKLMTLPKIGPVIAERIIRYREDYGQFLTLEDLAHVKGIGPRTLDQLRSQITF